MDQTNLKASKGMNVHLRRAISYVVLALITVMCLIWFYILFINSTRSHAELTRGFTVLPSTYLMKNFQKCNEGYFTDCIRYEKLSHRISDFRCTLYLLFYHDSICSSCI